MFTKLCVAHVDHDRWNCSEYGDVLVHWLSEIVVRRGAKQERTSRHARSERGASLILALMFTTSVAFMIAASLDFAASSFGQSTGQTRFRSGIYAAEGSVRTLIEAMRGDAAWGRAGPACGGLTLPVGDGRSAVAACVPAPGSGATLGGGSGSRANRVVELTGTIGTNLIVRARVLFNDNGGASAGTAVTIVEWSAAL